MDYKEYVMKTLKLIKLLDNFASRFNIAHLVESAAHSPRPMCCVNFCANSGIEIYKINAHFSNVDPGIARNTQEVTCFFI